MKYRIDRGVPIPKTNLSRKPMYKTVTRTLELLEAMKPIQDSVFFEGASTQEIYNKYNNPALRHGMAIIVRKVDGGTRLWREY